MARRLPNLKRLQLACHIGTALPKFILAQLS